MTDARDEMDRGADVIVLPSSMGYRANEFEAQLDQAPVRRDPDAWRAACQHHRSWVNLPARRVVCRDCKAELDPYQVLDDLARAREQLIGEARHLRLDIEQRRAERARAEREERNAKSRLSAVRKKLRKHGIDPYRIERGERKPSKLVADADGFTF